MWCQSRIARTVGGNAQSAGIVFIQKRWKSERNHQRDFSRREGAKDDMMQIIENMED